MTPLDEGHGAGGPGATTALLRRAKAGDAAALDELYGRFTGRLHALIRLRMGPSLRARMDSRDLLQDCLLRSFENIDRLEADESAPLMAWLARIAENEIRERAAFHGRQRRDARRDAGLDAAGPLADTVRSALSRVVLDERTRRLEEALERLAPQHREVVVLRKLEERTWADVAARLGRSEDAARMLLARAMAALTRDMENEA